MPPTLPSPPDPSTDPARGAREPFASRSAEAYACLAALPLMIRPGAPTSGYLHLTGRHGTPYARVKLTVSPDTDLRGLSTELPAHLSTLPDWKLPLPEHHCIEYVHGYQVARHGCLPDGGLFVSAFLLTPETLPCSDPDGPKKDAFMAGARAYLSQVRTVADTGRARHPQHTTMQRTG